MEDLPFIDEHTELEQPQQPAREEDIAEDKKMLDLLDTFSEEELVEDESAQGLREDLQERYQESDELEFEDEFTEEEESSGETEEVVEEDDEEELEDEEDSEDDVEEYEEIGEVLDDDVEIPITKEDGTVEYVTYGEVTKSYQNQQIIAEAAKQLQEQMDMFAKERDAYASNAEVIMFDAERNLQRYSDMTDDQWNALYNEDPVRYAEHQEYIARQNKLLNEAKTEWASYQRRKEERAAIERQAKNEANEAAITEYIPNLNDELIRDVFKHAMDNLKVPKEVFNEGIPEPDRFIGWYESLLRKRDIEGYDKVKLKKTTIKPTKRRVGKPANTKRKSNVQQNFKSFSRNGYVFDEQVAELLSDL